MAYKLNLKNNPELAASRRRFQNRAWYARNRAHVIAQHKQWRDENPGYDAQWVRDKRQREKQ